MSLSWAANRPQWRPVWRLQSLLLCLSFPCSVWSQAPAAPAAPADASSWITTIQQSARQSYVGNLVYSTDEGLFSSRLARYVSTGQVWEHMESMDGPQQRVFRHNDTTHTIWPSQRVVTIEQRGAIGESLGLPEIDRRVLDQYELRLVGKERVAGRETHVLLLKPKDELRFAQRLWTDRATGLLLRADVVHPSGKVLESVAFANIDLDVRPTRDQTQNPARRLEGYRVVQMTSEPSTLEALGWMVERLPAGFKLLGCVQRPMGDPQVDQGGKPLRVVQAVFSDGLARVSLFVESADPARQRKALSTHLGATHTLIVPRDERWWITAMGDVPLSTLKLFAENLVRKP